MKLLSYMFQSHANRLFRCLCGAEISGGLQVKDSYCNADCAATSYVNNPSNTLPCGGRDSNGATVRAIYVNTNLMGCYQPNPPGATLNSSYVPPSGAPTITNSGATNVYLDNVYNTNGVVVGTATATPVASLVPVTWRTNLAGWSFFGCFYESADVVIRANDGSITGYPTLTTPGSVIMGQQFMTADYCLNYCQQNQMNYAALKFG